MANQVSDDRDPFYLNVAGYEAYSAKHRRAYLGNILFEHRGL